MKSLRYFLFGLFIIFLFTSCKAQRPSLIQKMNESANDQQIEDSVIAQLRNNNDLVIAYAIENFAWVKSIHYKIIAQKNSEWKAYVYNVNLMKQYPSKSFTEVKADKAACDALADFIFKSHAWNIKGDNGSNFCPNEKANCNINDAASSRLWIITKKSVFNPSYYAPEFYERCCSDSSRALFLSIKNKIEGSANFAEGTTE